MDRLPCGVSSEIEGHVLNISVAIVNIVDGPVSGDFDNVHLSIFDPFLLNYVNTSLLHLNDVATKIKMLGPITVMASANFSWATKSFISSSHFI